MLQQFRFHPYGIPALLFLPLALAHAWAAGPTARRRVWLAAAALVTIACVPAIPDLKRMPPPGGSADFALTRGLYPALADACREAPGPVLADNDDGHAIRFLTDCPVIANNLVLTPESWAKLRESVRLLDLPPHEMRTRAPWVRYVLVLRNDDPFAPADPAAIARQNSTLRRALLFGPPPPGFTLLAEVRLDTGGDSTPLGRVFAVAPP